MHQQTASCQAFDAVPQAPLESRPFAPTLVILEPFRNREQASQDGLALATGGDGGKCRRIRGVAGSKRSAVRRDNRRTRLVIKHGIGEVVARAALVVHQGDYCARGGHQAQSQLAV